MLKTEKDSVIERYSDFLTNLDPHPQKKDVVRITNEAAVRRSIKNLISTSKGERLFQYSIGCNLKNKLFEPMDLTTQKGIENDILETIANHEPRAIAPKVVVQPFYEQNAYLVSVYFYIVNRNDPVQVNVTLERIR
jgi:phage baseplate assembly protein W